MNILQNLTLPHINLSGLAREVGLSSNFISRCIKGEKKLSPVAQWDIVRTIAPIQLNGWVLSRKGVGLVAVIFSDGLPTEIKHIGTIEEFQDFLMNNT